MTFEILSDGAETTAQRLFFTCVHVELIELLHRRFGAGDARLVDVLYRVVAFVLDEGRFEVEEAELSVAVAGFVLVLRRLVLLLDVVVPVVHPRDSHLRVEDLHSFAVLLLPFLRLFLFTKAVFHFIDISLGFSAPFFVTA